MTNLTRTQFQSHPYHMVEPSPWPLLTSFAVLTMTVSAALWFNGIQHADILLTLGFLSTLSAFILWFRDIVTEGTYLGDHTFAVQKGITMGVALFILSRSILLLFYLLGLLPLSTCTNCRTWWTLASSRYRST